MTVTIFMNMSTDGFIANNNDDVPFISDDEWQVYLDIVRKSDALIVGRKTYEAMVEADDFGELKNPKTVVITHSKNLKADTDNISFSSNSAQDIVQELQMDSFGNIFVGGGAETNALFLKENLVDFIKICVSPYLLGKGISFLNNASCEKKLELEKSTPISNGAVLLEYKVK